MIADLLRQMVDGLFSPRASARRVLAANFGLDAVVFFVVLAYAIQAILQIVIPGARQLPEGMEGVPIGMHLVNLLVQGAVVAIFTIVIHVVGRMFGGTGTRSQALVIVAWHTLVTTLLAPIFLFGFSTMQHGEIPQGALFLMMIAGVIWLWVLANYTAELHGFRSAWNVFGVAFGVTFLVSALAVNMVSLS